MSEAVQRIQDYRVRLAAAQTFEEYRHVHLSWVDMLIEETRQREEREATGKVTIQYALVEKPKDEDGGPA